MIKSYTWLLVSGVVLSLVASQGLGYVLWTPLINFVLFIVFMWVMIVGHEAIHALTLRALGGRVFEMALGAGQIRYKLEWRGVRFSLRQGLILGLCVGAFPQTSRLRLRWLLFISAPLVAQILLVVWLLPQLDWTHFVTGAAVAEVLVVVNLLFIATNLYPKRFSAYFATDGYWLWEIIRGHKTADELHGFYYALAGGYAFEREAYGEGLAVSQSGLERYPENDLIRNVVAVSCMGLERHREAVGHFEYFLDKEASAAITPTRGLYLNNLAGTLFRLALEPGGIRPDEMAKAHAAAQEAFFLLPWMGPIGVVQAISFYHQGYYQASIDRLAEALVHQERDSQRASIFAYTALSQHALGQEKAALDSLAQARRLNPKGNWGLTRIGAIVEGGPADRSAAKAGQWQKERG